jgi:hypothetical protein
MGRTPRNPIVAVNRARLVARGKAAFRTLVATTVISTRPTIERVAERLARDPDGTVDPEVLKKRKEGLGAYLAPGNTLPNADTAFDIGEALYEMGYDWMHGLAMVDGGAGHKEDVVGCLATMLYQQNNVPEEMLDDLFAMLYTIDDLWLETNYDMLEMIGVVHKTTRISLAEAWRIYWQIQSAFRPGPMDAEPPFTESTSALNFFKREVAKRACAQAARYARPLKDAWIEWRRERNTDLFGPSEWPSAAIVVARDRYTDLDKKSRQVRLLIGQWFSNLTIIDDTPLNTWSLDQKYRWESYLPYRDPDDVRTFALESLLMSIGTAESILSQPRGLPIQRSHADAASKDDAASRDTQE